MSRAEMRELQLARIKASVELTYERIKPVREKFDAIGLKPSHIKSLKDVRNIPFTTKTDMREAYPYGLFAVPMKDVVRLHASSGTTGRPTVVGYTQGDLDMWASVMARLVVMAGANADDVAQISFGYGLFTGALGLHYALEKIGATVVPVSAGNTERQIMLMRDFGATLLISTPSYALVLAEAIEKSGIPRDEFKLRVGLFGGEGSTAEMRREIDKRLGVLATQNYGLSEIIGPGVSGECHLRCGLHINEDHFYCEIVDPDTGEPLPTGEFGELVITTLTKEATPMLRYRTRDLTRLDDTPCACGRTLARHDPITGRSDDMLIIRGVNVFPSQIESALLTVDGIGPHYEIIVSRKGYLDSLEVKVELTDGRLLESFGALESLENQIRNKMRATLSVDVKVSLCGPNTLKRFEGKAKRVTDLRGKES